MLVKLSRVTRKIGRSSRALAVLAVALSVGACSIDDEARAVNEANDKLASKLKDADTDQERAKIWKKHKGEIEEAYEELAEAKKGILKLGMDEDTNKEMNRVLPRVRGYLEFDPEVLDEFDEISGRNN